MRRAVVGGSLAGLVLVASVGAIALWPTSAQAPSVSPRVSFDAPSSISSNGTNVWVVNRGNNTLTRLDATTGAVAATIVENVFALPASNAVVVNPTDAYVSNADDTIADYDQSSSRHKSSFDGGVVGFANPGAMALTGHQLYVINTEDDRILELNTTTGQVVATLLGPSSGFLNPDALCVTHGRLYVASSELNAVAMVSTATHAYLGPVNSAAGHLDAPVALSCDAQHVWVANRLSSTVTELDARSGAVLRVVAAGIDAPQAIVSSPRRVFVADDGDDRVAMLEAGSGALLKVVGAAHTFNQPGAMALDPRHLWVANTGGTSVVELDATSGAVLKRIR